MTYKIVKNKKLPAHAKGTGRPVKYPFSEMEVGDAFEVTDASGDRATRNVLLSCARAYVKRHAPSSKFATRIVDGRVWVWRVA